MAKVNIIIKAKLIFISFALILSGCSNLYSYKSENANNVIMLMDKASDSNIKGRADFFLIDRKNCRQTYKGSSWFNKKPEHIGLKNNQSYIVDFNFLVSSWLRGDSSVAERRMLEIKPGYKYEARLFYEDELYELRLYEINIKNNKKKKVRLDYNTSCDYH